MPCIIMMTAAERKRLSRQRQKEKAQNLSGAEEEPECIQPTQVVKMGRPTKPDKMSSEERKRKSRQNAIVREREKEARKNKEFCHA